MFEAHGKIAVTLLGAGLAFGLSALADDSPKIEGKYQARIKEHAAQTPEQTQEGMEHRSLRLAVGALQTKLAEQEEKIARHAQAIADQNKPSIGATITGVFQRGEFSGTGIGKLSRSTVVTDVGINFQPTERDEFDLAVSFAVGNALNDVSPYAAHPLYADDLEDDLKNINGRNRDYLLTAWYKRTTTLSRDLSLGVTGGIINATGYIDDNQYANDEVGQFMNEAFVNNTLMVPPDFDAGIAIELEMDRHWSARAVWISSKTDGGPGGEDAPDSYNYFGGQLGYHTDLGNYRLWVQGTSRDFLDPAGLETESLLSTGVSLDHQLTDTIGIFARLGWQKDDAAVDHEMLYSGGLNISGKAWGRNDDEVGLGFAHLDGGNGDIEETNVLEAYVKFQLSEYADLSLDVQYLNEEKADADDPHGFVYGARMNGYF